jgi:hypothetical protein
VEVEATEEERAAEEEAAEQQAAMGGSQRRKIAAEMREMEARKQSKTSWVETFEGLGVLYLHLIVGFISLGKEQV